MPGAALDQRKRTMPFRDSPRSAYVHQSKQTGPMVDFMMFAIFVWTAMEHMDAALAHKDAALAHIVSTSARMVALSAHTAALSAHTGAFLAQSDATL